MHVLYMHFTPLFLFTCQHINYMFTDFKQSTTLICISYLTISLNIGILVKYIYSRLTVVINTIRIQLSRHLMILSFKLKLRTKSLINLHLDIGSEKAATFDFRNLQNLFRCSPP